MSSWIKLTEETQLAEIKKASGYSLIFKHSTRCSISMMAKKKVEMDLDDLPQDIPLYFLDLIAFRSVSQTIAEVFQVHHESPQLLLIKDGECILDQSHGEISIEETLEVIV